MKVIINVAFVTTLGLCLSSSGSTIASTTTASDERKAFMVVKKVASSRSTASADRKSRGESHRDHLRVREGVRNNSAASSSSSSSSSSRYIGGADYDHSASEDHPASLQLHTPAAITAVERFLSTNSPLLLEGETFCANEEECKAKSIELGYLFYTTTTTTTTTDPPANTSSATTSSTIKGCFMKNNKIVFYIPGSEEEMSVTTLPGIQERVYCSSNTMDNSVEGIYSPSSSSSSSSSTMSTTTTTTTAATPTSLPDLFDDGSLEITPIGEVGNGSGNSGEDLSLDDIEDLSSLGALIDATGLLNELGTIGPFTLFAPNNAAISKFLSNGGGGADTDGIQDIVLYHVVPGKYSSSSLTTGELVTMNDNSISVQVSDTGGVTLNDVANVIKADIALGEGTVHVIDMVLIPPAAAAAAPVPAVATTTSAPTKEVTTMKPTTMKPVQNTPEFINPNLKPGEPAVATTTSAPTTEVTTMKPTTMKPVQNTPEFINPNLKPGIEFDIAGSCNSQEECSATTRSQKPAGSSVGVDMCECYATSSTAPFDECEAEQTCATVKCAGNACVGYEAYCDFATREENGNRKLGECKLRQMETSTTNPPASLIAQEQPTTEPTTVKDEDINNIDDSMTLGDLTMSITEFVKNSVDLKVLDTLIEQTGLLDDLGDVGPLTIFAPNDGAIAEFLKTFPGGFVNTTKTNLQDLLLYHVVAGSYNSSTLETGGIKTLNGKSLSVDVSEMGILVNDANIITSDIELFDGTIHIIDKVLVPPGDDNEQEEFDDDEKIDLVLNTTGYSNPNNKPGDAVSNTPQNDTTTVPNPNTVEGVTTSTTQDGQLIDVYVNDDFVEAQPSESSSTTGSTVNNGASLPPSTFSSFPTPVGEVPDDGDAPEASGGNGNGESTGSEVPTYSPTLTYIPSPTLTTSKPSFVINANFDSAGSAIACNTLIVGMLGVVVTFIVSFII